MHKLDELLLVQHKPVGRVVGMYYLPIYAYRYRFHFNGHNICIIGKDEAKNEYSVLDTNVILKEKISYKDLLKVRFAIGGTYPLIGQMYWIESVPTQLPDLKPLILKSINRTCKGAFALVHGSLVRCTWYIISVEKKLGVGKKKMGQREARQNLAQVIRMLEEIGTGGAGFRFIYAAFLQEAAAVTNIADLNTYSKRMTEIGDKWREFAYKGARIIKKRKGESFTYNDLGDILEQISVLEKDFFCDLRCLIAEHSK